MLDLFLIQARIKYSYVTIFKITSLYDDPSRRLLKDWDGCWKIGEADNEDRPEHFVEWLSRFFINVVLKREHQSQN